MPLGPRRLEPHVLARSKHGRMKQIVSDNIYISISEKHAKQHLELGNLKGKIQHHFNSMHNYITNICTIHLRASLV